MVIRKAERPMIYGTPLFSTFPYFPPKEGVPLKALFFLSHGRRNRLLPLSQGETLKRFLSETPSISWVPEGFPFSADFSLDLCCRIPAYALSFVPNERIVPFLKASF